MLVYVGRRLFLGVVTIWAIITLVFFTVRLIPGDPAEIMLGQYGTPSMVQALRQQMGTDKPLYQQYVGFFSQLAHGDLGISPITQQPVMSDISSQYVFTLELAAASLFICLAIGIPAGALAAFHRGRRLDLGVSVGTLVWLAMPDFWLGLMLLLIFSVQLDWLPLSGVGSLGPLDTAYHLILPAFALGASQAAIIARMFRSAVLNVIGQDFVRTARAKGIGGARLLWNHILRNAFPSIVNVAIINSVILLAGSVVIETVFSRPGVGRLLVTAVGQKDYPTIQGCLLFFAISVVTITLFADIASAALDPRIRSGILTEVKV